MSYLLNLAYLAALALVWPWLLYKSIRQGKYREGFAAKFFGAVPRRQSGGPCLWLHAVSVGEVNLLSTLLAEIQRRRPDWECVISTTTMTGYSLAKKKYAGRSVFYCPLDFSWAVRSAMRRIRPDCLVLAELELWPNLIRAAREQGARVAVVNGRLSQRSHRGYRRVRPLISRLLRQLDLIAVQNDEYAGRFLDLGASPEAVHITGSMKFDGAQTDRRNPATLRLRRLAGIGDGDVVFLAGSTQEPEEALALAAYRELALEYPRLRLILVPRHPERFDAVAQLLDESGIGWQRRSILKDKPPTDDAWRATDDGPEIHPTVNPKSKIQNPKSKIPPVLLVDAIGELGAWWGMAQVAFVGGSLGQRGGQNMIEPAAYGAAVSFGPNTRNFRDIVALLLAARAAVVVQDGDELTAFVRRALADRHFAEGLGELASRLVAGQLGATSRTFELLAPLIEDPVYSATPNRAAA
ncbi:MAG TPA: 3-deoxy-D-manno-octulosonic acid transferase [Pirellulales bacterium]|nr:3-deoxy-D-manno-octulosonic acid transferase [Pirellulales bacterium]